ncbi:DUF4422 domain-containing protein [Pediococcus parvulus]|uniref:DUF4422 domain-containing protein n=1 Tax=Pediococcus parvulus TaxID=54062 RepID=UPI00345E2C3D
MKIKILVAAHKNFPMPKDKELYLPILVGATKNYKNGMNFQRDDQGKNISLKNPKYNELTAVYWAWKNIDAEAVGLVHYRRYFSLHKKRSLDSVICKQEVEKLLMNNSVILPKKRKYYIETNYSHYIHAHHKEPLNMTRTVIQENYPEYLESFDRIMNLRTAHMFNMFIMKKDLFDTYASWLFSILFEVEKRIDITKYSVQETRVFGYLSELLLNVWLNQNQVSYREVPWIQLGNRNLVRKAFSFLSRKIGFRSKTHF